MASSDKLKSVNVPVNIEYLKPLTGSHVVNLGDSIFGNTRGANAVSTFIADKTGATIYNIGFGGSRIAQHVKYWDAFSLYRLADEIVKDDTDETKWQYQDEAISASDNGLVSGMPAYFDQQLGDLKAIDFNTIDFITVAGGTNDYTASVAVDNAKNRLDITTFAGSLRYSISKIMTKHQHLKVLICTPMYRFWRNENGTFIDDSDTRLYSEQTLLDFVGKAKEVCKEFKTPVLDNYYELGINKQNKELYFPSNDGTHPNATGNQKLGYKIGSALISKF